MLYFQMEQSVKLVLPFIKFVLSTNYFLFNISLREAPPKLSPGSKGHCPNSDCTPPPSVNRALWGTLFSDRIEQLCQITVLMVISAQNHHGKHFGPLHNQAITHLNQRWKKRKK